ncbi:WNTA protein [Sarcoptes scabiei]|nr:WNTA protein [Sarcoptes scabiei]
MGNQLNRTSFSSASNQSQTKLSLRRNPSSRDQSDISSNDNCNANDEKKIVVVNPGPNSTAIDSSDNDLVRKISEKTITTLLPIDKTTAAKFNQTKLSEKPILKIGQSIERNLAIATEAISKEQQNITEKIRVIDQRCHQLTSQYAQEKQRRFNKAFENFKKFDEVLALMESCESDIEQLLTMFAKLNSALPESLCLEHFQLTTE